MWPSPFVKYLYTHEPVCFPHSAFGAGDGLRDCLREIRSIIEHGRGPNFTNHRHCSFIMFPIIVMARCVVCCPSHDVYGRLRANELIPDCTLIECDTTKMKSAASRKLQLARSRRALSLSSKIPGHGWAVLRRRLSTALVECPTVEVEGGEHRQGSGFSK